MHYQHEGRFEGCCFFHVIGFYFSRMEDLTNPEDIRTNIKCDRKVSLYGYLRGAYLKNKSQIHMPGIPYKISVFLELWEWFHFLEKTEK